MSQCHLLKAYDDFKGMLSTTFPTKNQAVSGMVLKVVDFYNVTLYTTMSHFAVHLKMLFLSCRVWWG
jgi:hypothetical protein